MNEDYILKIKLEDGEFTVSVNGVTKTVGTLKKALDEGKKGAEGLSDALKDTSKKNEGLIKDAGLAGATLTEFGRTISDLPFGIQGVANNLSQLSTLFITLVSKSKEGGSTLGGFRKALGRLKDQLFGPLGIILAFQAVIALLDFFSRRTKKAEEDLTSFNDALSKNILISKQFQTLLDDANISLAERERILKAASNRHSQLQKLLSDENLTQEERNKKAERFLELEDARLNLTKASQKEEKQLFVARDNLTKKQEELNELKSKELEFDEGFVVTAEDRKAAIDAVALAEKELNLTTKAFITFQQKLADITVQQNELLESNTGAKKDNAKATTELNAIELEGLNFFTVKAEAEERLMQIQKDRRKIEFQDIRTNLSEEIASLKLRTKSREEFERKKIDLILDAMRKEIESIQMSLDTDRLSVEERLKLRERLAILTVKVAETEDEKLRALLGKIKEFVGTMTSLISDFNDAELSAAERNTVLINNQLRERLKNERLSAKERESINAQIAQNEEKLQKKRDEIALRNFRLQKAFAISTALINTFLAVSEALPNIPKAIAVGALGAAQVAAILATKFVPSANSVPSGSAGAGLGRRTAEAQDPAFNIVGTGQQFQLAQVIAQRTGEPIRAFVVSGDVRTGLALDRNIINSSKIN
tara:strand:- start:7275 stop:9230 length:1956 start_codon:yes stop_codon:yes gene_type:complete